MQRPAKAVVVGASFADDVSPYLGLLMGVIKVAVKDARQRHDMALCYDAWRFLWAVVPTVAERMDKEEIDG